MLKYNVRFTWPHSAVQFLTLTSLYTSLPLFAGNIRLVGGSVPSEGRVELFYEGQWGRVLTDRLDTQTKLDIAARISCQQVGYPYTNGTAYFGEGNGSILVGITCSGFEERVEQCHHLG